MATQESQTVVLLEVIDAINHPHGGRILRTRVSGDSTPTLAELKGHRFRASNDRGDERTVRIDGFSIFGGKPSDERLRESGRIDLVITEMGDGAPVAVGWTLTPVESS